MSETADKMRIIVVYRGDLPEMTRAKGEVQFGHAVESVVAEAVPPDALARIRDELAAIVGDPDLAMAAALRERLRALSDLANGLGIDRFRQHVADNQPKLSMEVPDLAALLKIKAKAERRGVPHFLVTDAAHTVFAEPTVTAIGLGPLTKTDGNALTRDARMRD
jgi:peptidyl-tRNA hydrolase